MGLGGLLLVAALGAWATTPVAADEAQALTDVCFNGCSGHGACANFACACDTGWFGDDCRHSFAAGSGGDGSGSGSNAIVPILGAGDYNLTAKNFSKAVQRKSLTLVGFSSRHCHKCIVHERAYAAAHAQLKALGVPLARADRDVFRSQLHDLNLHDMPALVLYKKGKATPYLGAHSAGAIGAWVAKQLAPAVTPLASVDQVLAFADLNPHETSALDPEATSAAELAATAVEAEAVEILADGRVGGSRSDNRSDSFAVRSGSSRPPGSCSVVGFFSDPNGMEEDEYQEFAEVRCSCVRHARM
jgi:hypothetical protein